MRKNQSYLGSVAVVFLAALITGCGAVGLAGSDSTHPLDNGHFMDLWKTYSQCQTTNDLQTLQDESTQLSHAAYSDRAASGFVLPLPEKIERLVVRPQTRLAVDLKAMALACTLRAGQIAQQVGRNDVAQEMYKSILASEGDATYAYYRAQAKAGLAEVEIGLQASLRLH